MSKNGCFSMCMWVVSHGCGAPWKELPAEFLVQRFITFAEEAKSSDTAWSSS